MKKVIIAVIIVLLLAGGGFLLLKHNKKSNNSANSTNDSQTSSNSSSNSTSPGFDALSNTGVSYAATITSSANGKTTTSNMEFDKSNGAIRYSVGKDTVVIYTKDAYYMCQGSAKCFKYPLKGSSAAGFDPSAYQYSANKLAGLKSSSTDKGTQSCPAGTCHVWGITSGSYSSEVFVDTNTKRISQVVGTTAVGTSKIVYDYKEVSITIPTNTQSLPTMHPN